MKNQTQYKICYILRQTDMYVFFCEKAKKNKKAKSVALAPFMIM